MSNKPHSNSGIRIFRERVFIKHTSPEERELSIEITLINESTTDVGDIFLFRDGFLVGLKIFDTDDTELVFYPNELTKKLFRTFMKNDCFGGNIYNHLLERMETDPKIFVLWIKLPPDNPLKPFSSRIIKLVYRDDLPSLKLSFRDSFYSLKFLFSIPRFTVQNTKPIGVQRDIFYVITAPEDCQLQYNIIKNVKILFDQPIKLESRDGVYIDNKNKKVISIRIPPIKEETKFDMIYDVVPKKSERGFNFILLISLIAVSVFVTLIGVDLIHLQTIKNHSNTIFGGIITASLAYIGYSKKSISERMRFWLLIPIITSVIGFLVTGFNQTIPLFP